MCAAGSIYTEGSRQQGRGAALGRDGNDDGDASEAAQRGQQAQRALLCMPRGLHTEVHNSRCREKGAALGRDGDDDGDASEAAQRGQQAERGLRGALVVVAVEEALMRLQLEQQVARVPARQHQTPLFQSRHMRSTC